MISLRLPKPDRNYLLIAAVSVISTILLWLPFYLRLPSFWGIPLPEDGMATIVANYDGPYYIVAAKSLYQPQIITSKFEFPLPVKYYSAHWPAYPLVIRLFATILPFLSYPYAMLAATQISSILTAIFFYKLLKKVGLSQICLPLTLIFLFFPARYFIVRSIGSPEPLFLLGIIASLYYFLDRKFLLAGIFGALAQATKSPAILLFVAYFVTFLLNSWPHIVAGNFTRLLSLKKILRRLPLLLIPLTALAVFLWYNHTYQDFFAYFHSGDNIHLLFPPFQSFNSSLPWVGSFWLEEIIFIYCLEIFAIISIAANPRLRPLTVFASIFFLATIFISHRDLSRYSLPLAPIIIIAASPLLAKKWSSAAFALLLLPIYLFSLNFIAQNAAPISNWIPLL